MNHRRRLFAATMAMIALVPAAVAIAVTSQQSATAAPTQPPGFSTVWTDDFSGPAGAGLNTSNWLYDLGTGYPGGAANWGTHEVETVTNSTNNVYQDGAGHLAIKPIKDAAGNWTSGRIESKRTDFQPPPGGVLHVEASLKQPDVTTANGAGYWPAFWMLGAAARPAAATNWPGIGEIDIMEDINGRSSEFSTLHCGVAPGGPCNEFSGIGSGERACAGCQTGFHTYAMELDYSTSPQQIRYYLDGSNFFTINASQFDAATWNATTQHGFYMILNVAIGGDFPAAFGGGPNAATVSGQPMLVDYVTVATKGGGGTTTTTPPTTTTTTGGGSGSNAYATIAPTSHSDASAGLDVTRLANGAWARYPKLDFGSTAGTQFVARAASGAAGGVSGLVEVRLDSRTNAPIGSFAIANTGGWTSWRTIPANISAVTGVHDVYLTFTSGQPAAFVSLNSFTFGH